MKHKLNRVTPLTLRFTKVLIDINCSVIPAKLPRCLSFLNRFIKPAVSVLNVVYTNCSQDETETFAENKTETKRYYMENGDMLKVEHTFDTSILFE